MSLQKLGRQLKREIKTNPKKAVALGILFLVAAYFWAPLILKSKGPESTAPMVANAAPASPAATGAINTTNKPAPQYRWQDLDREMNRDPRMDCTSQDIVERLARNPFVGRTITIAAAETKPETKSEDDEDRGPVVVTPEDAGLTLSGTVLGTRRTALISGKVYAEGREVETQDGIVFVVRAVESRRVVLEREGQKFELEMSRKRGAEPATEKTDAKPHNLEAVIDSLLKQNDE